MLANIPPPRLPMKRANPVKRSGGLVTAAIVVVGLTIAAAGGFHGSEPGQVADTPAAGMMPQNRTVHGAMMASQSNGGGAGYADDTHVFHGYPCTIDCSGHKAGFNWAKDQGIREAGRCPIAPANLMSLTEGCWAETGRNGPYAQQ